MGIPVMILGESGSGKSSSLRNFDEKEVMVFNVANKPLPFRRKLASIKGQETTQKEYGCIKAYIEKYKDKVKSYVIDDSQYLMAFEMFEKAKETGYGKFTDCALNFYNLVQFVIKDTPDDVIVYFLHHIETSDTGKVKAKTSGKMLDSQLTLEGLFSIVLMAQTDGKEYKFITQSDGYTTCKSPLEMFEESIENDLKFVDTAIREYWDLNSKNESEDK